MMGRLKESRWVYILLSILLATVFWMYVRLEMDPEDSTVLRNVRVELTGTNVLAGQGLTVADMSHETVNLSVRAPVSVITNLIQYRSSIYVPLDVSRCAEGENVLSYVPRWPSNFNVSEVVLEEQSPATITVTVEKLYTKTAPVEFRLDGQVAQGYQMGTPAIEPVSVVVSGPVEQVNQVHTVAAILKQEKLDERFAGDLPLIPLDEKGEPLDDLEITLSSDTAYVVVPVVVERQGDLAVEILPGGGAVEADAVVTIEPESIAVSGAEEDMEGLTEIFLGSIDLSDVVGSRTFTFPISQDPRLENVSGITTAQVTVTVDGLATAAFPVSNIINTQPPEGYVADIVTHTVPVTVRGPQEALDTIDASQFRIVADLSRVRTLGSSRIPVRVYLDGNSSVGVIGDYSIVVNISR